MQLSMPSVEIFPHEAFPMCSRAPRDAASACLFQLRDRVCKVTPNDHISTRTPRQHNTNTLATNPQQSAPGARTRRIFEQLCKFSIPGKPYQILVSRCSWWGIVARILGGLRDSTAGLTNCGYVYVFLFVMVASVF